MDTIKDFIAGGIAGLSISIIGHPFDTIKTRMQYNKKLILTPTYLYKGFKYSAIKMVPTNAISFSLNNEINKTTQNNYLSGFITGTFLTFIINPLDVWKILAQNTIKNNSLNVNYWRGLHTTFARESISSAIYFGTYFQMREYYDNKYPLFVGGISGTLSWLFTYPIDVVKTRIQTNHNITLLDKSLYKKLWKGISPCLVRGFISNGVCFYVYEFTISKLNKY